jgi:hypothetical protein
MNVLGGHSQTVPKLAAVFQLTGTSCVEFVSALSTEHLLALALQVRYHFFGNNRTRVMNFV